MRWIDIKSDEFPAAVEACNGVCVIPIGCVEAHGTHMPLGCDTIATAEYARRAAEVSPVCVFPEMYFGEKSGAGEFPGTIIFPTRLIWDILEQCCSEIARNGFKKIVLLNGHGGNTQMLQSFTRYILQKKTDYLVYCAFSHLIPPQNILAEIEKYPYLTQEDIAVLQSYVDEKELDGHGGFTETGALYDVCPELIDLNKWGTVSGETCHRMDAFDEADVYSPFTWMANFPNSLDGPYHAGLNERIAKAFGQKTVEQVAKTFKFIREETVSLEYHKEWLAKQ